MPSAPKLEAPQGQPLFDVQFRAISESLAGNGVVSNGDLEVSDGTNALEIDVAAGTAYYIATEYSFAGASPAATLSAGDANYDRWDTVAFDTADQTITVREGVAEQYPEPPDIAGGEMLLALVYVPAGATDIADSNILNWRAKFSNESEEVHYDDSEGFYGQDSVEGALDQANDLLVRRDYPANSGAVVLTDMPVDGNAAAGSEQSLNWAVDGETMLTLYTESDGAGGTQTKRVVAGDPDQTGTTPLGSVRDVSGTAIVAEFFATSAGSAVFTNRDWDANTVRNEFHIFPNEVRFFSDLTLDTGETLLDYANAVVPPARRSDMGTEDLTAESGAVTIFDNADNHVPREQVDDERITTGPHTTNVTTSGEEVVLVDTSGGPVTVTLSSADTTSGNFVSVVDVGGSAGTNAITINTEAGENIDGESSKTMETSYGALIVSSDGTNWFTAGGSGAGGIGIEDNGGTVLDPASGIDFGTDLTATDNGDGTVTVDSDAAGVTVLASGTFTHTGGSATSQTIAGVTGDQTANLHVEVGVDADPGFAANYAWDYTWGEAWDDTNSEKDVTIDAAWDTDPGSGNDLTLDYRIYTLDVSASKSRIQDLVDSPNGNIPTALLEDTESIEISIPVPDGESLKVYRWGAYKLADGTAPAGLQVQLLDGSDTVQASANTTNSENLSSPVASFGNASGSLSIFKLRIDNATGTAFTSDGVGGIFAYVVE